MQKRKENRHAFNTQANQSIFVISSRKKKITVYTHKSHNIYIIYIRHPKKSKNWKIAAQTMQMEIRKGESGKWQAKGQNEPSEHSRRKQ